MNDDILGGYDYEGNPINTHEKAARFYLNQLKVLGDFILQEYDDKICGSAVETAITVMKIQEQKIKRLQKTEQDYFTVIAMGGMHQEVEGDPKNAKTYPAVNKAGKINLKNQKPKTKKEQNDAFNRAKAVV